MHELKIFLRYTSSVLWKPSTEPRWNWKFKSIDVEKVWRVWSLSFFRYWTVLTQVKEAHEGFEENRSVSKSSQQKYTFGLKLLEWFWILKSTYNVTEKKYNSR